jgi:hypothetical protein
MITCWSKTDQESHGRNEGGRIEAAGAVELGELPLDPLDGLCRHGLDLRHSQHLDADRLGRRRAGPKAKPAGVIARWTGISVRPEMYASTRRLPMAGDHRAGWFPNG